MLITQENINIWYNEYLKQYERTKKYVTSRGGKVRNIKPSSMSSFKIDFLSTVSDNKNMSGKQIAQKMAKQELYETSWSQAKRFAQAHVEKFGGKLTMALVQQYQIDTVKGQTIWDVIRVRREELVSSGSSTYEANMIIGQEFFGSE